MGLSSHFAKESDGITIEDASDSGDKEEMAEFTAVTDEEVAEKQEAETLPEPLQTADQAGVSAKMTPPTGSAPKKGGLLTRVFGKRK